VQDGPGEQAAPELGAELIAVVVVGGQGPGQEPGVAFRNEPDFNGDGNVGEDQDGGGQMGILTDDMKRLVDEQKLAFHATVRPDGSPNLSPKGSTRVWDDDHLFFADICSPQTVANIRAGSLIEVNVVDPFVRKGYRFKGRAVIHEPGAPVFAEGVERMRADGSKLTGRVKAIVMIEVRDAAALVSPAYDDGATTEAEMLETQRARFARLHERHERG
jgi:predicted pyridoxine 5'-phosphate oxidase superfamily flavin-nucleotide-binding protein